MGWGGDLPLWLTGARLLRSVAGSTVGDVMEGIASQEEYCQDIDFKAEAEKRQDVNKILTPTWRDIFISNYVQLFFILFCDYWGDAINVLLCPRVNPCRYQRRSFASVKLQKLPPSPKAKTKIKIKVKINSVEIYFSARKKPKRFQSDGGKQKAILS